MSYENQFLEIDYTKYGNSPKTHFSQLTDEVIAKGMVKYLRKYMRGNWSGISAHGHNFLASDFFQTAEIVPSRFYQIFKTTQRTEQFLNYFKKYNVEVKMKHGFLSLIDLEHPNHKNY